MLRSSELTKRRVACSALHYAVLGLPPQHAESSIRTEQPAHTHISIMAGFVIMLPISRIAWLAGAGTPFLGSRQAVQPCQTRNEPVVSTNTREDTVQRAAAGVTYMCWTAGFCIICITCGFIGGMPPMSPVPPMPPVLCVSRYASYVSPGHALTIRRCGWQRGVHARIAFTRQRVTCFT